MVFRCAPTMRASSFLAATASAAGRVAKPKEISVAATISAMLSLVKLGVSAAVTHVLPLAVSAATRGSEATSTRWPRALLAHRIPRLASTHRAMSSSVVLAAHVVVTSVRLRVKFAAKVRTITSCVGRATNVVATLAKHLAASAAIQRA